MKELLDLMNELNAIQDRIINMRAEMEIVAVAEPQIEEFPEVGGVIEL